MIDWTRKRIYHSDNTRYRLYVQIDANDNYHKVTHYFDQQALEWNYVFTDDKCSMTMYAYITEIDEQHVRQWLKDNIGCQLITTMIEQVNRKAVAHIVTYLDIIAKDDSELKQVISRINKSTLDNANLDQLYDIAIVYMQDNHYDMKSKKHLYYIA